MAKKKQTIWVGIIPDIFGYGMSVLGNTEAECMKALKDGYKEWKKGYPDPSTNFKTSFENWGGFVREIELNKTYFDNFGE
jgi:predicted RNase H-like HicB family nuclease